MTFIRRFIFEELENGQIKSSIIYRSRLVILRLRQKVTLVVSVALIASDLFYVPRSMSDSAQSIDLIFYTPCSFIF